MNIFNANNAINSFGLSGIFFILFIETALPLVVGLPGDSLLFIAGLAASGTGSVIHVHISLWALVIGSPLAAILGSSFGHHLGHRYGSKLFTNPKSKFFNPSNLAKAQTWIHRYGEGKTIFLARFVPVVRHIVNPVCGIIKMPYRKFFFWNVLSAIIWTEGFVAIGYFIGQKLKGSVDHYIYPLVAIIVLASISPIIWEVYKERKKRKLQP
jgi:membrane-associated protein